jgi:hypothetical protein
LANTGDTIYFGSNTGVSTFDFGSAGITTTGTGTFDIVVSDTVQSSTAFNYIDYIPDTSLNIGTAGDFPVNIFANNAVGATAQLIVDNVDIDMNVGSVHFNAGNLDEIGSLTATTLTDGTISISSGVIYMGSGASISDGYYTSIDPYNRILYASGGVTLAIDYSETVNTNAALSFDGTMPFFQNGLAIASGAYIMSGTEESIDTNDRRLYASDGSTNILDWASDGVHISDGNTDVYLSSASAGSSAAGYFTDGTYQVWLAGQSQAGYFTDGTYTVYIADGSFAINASGDIRTDTNFNVGGLGGVSDTYDDGADTTITFSGGIATAISTPFNAATVTDKVLIPDVLDKISDLKPYTYKYDGKLRFGFLADDFLTNYSFATFDDRHFSKEKGYRKDAVIAILMKAVQELKKKNESLELRVKALEKP